MATRNNPRPPQKKPVPPRQSAPAVRPKPVSRTGFFQPGFWNAHRLPMGILLALAFALYGLTMGYGYLQDDQLVIWDNIFVQKGFGGLGEIFGNDSLLGYYKDKKLLLEGGRYRPLPLFTYALEIGLFGQDHPGIAHFFNVLLYGLTGILLYRILLGLFPLSEGGRWFFSLPFLAAALFMLHPLHVEAVANIKGRDEILSLLGSLGALYATLKHFDTGRNRWLAGAAFSLFLGLLAKENAATFLAVIPLTLYMFTRLPGGRIGTVVLVLLAAPLLYLLIRYNALGYMVHQTSTPQDLLLNPFAGMTVPEKYATIFLTLGWYLKLLLIPHPLTHDYYPYHVPKISWADWRAIGSLAVYAFLGIWAVLQLRKARKQDAGSTAGASLVPAWSILYFILTISVVSNLFVGTSTFMNERYAYMPSVAFAVLAGWFIARKLPEWMGQAPDRPYLAGLILVAIMAALFALRVWTRLPDWGGNGRGLVESAIRAAPESYRANYYYAAMLYQEQYLKIQDATEPAAAAERKGLVEAMEKHVDRALEIYPDYRPAVTLQANVAYARFREDRQLANLLQEFEQLIQRQPQNGDMLIYVIGVLKSLKGSDPNVYNRFCHRVGYDLYFKKLGDLNGAVEFLNHGLNNYPQDVNILQDLLEVYTAMGNQPKAAEMQQRLQNLAGPSINR
jgi:hypothetical protein